MKKIRIGKDILIRWTILTNGIPESLEERDVKIEITDKHFSKKELPLSVENNIITLTFPGNLHKRTGVYHLTLWENKGKEKQTAVDFVDAFCLVNYTSEEDGNDNALEIETLDLGYSNLDVLTSSTSGNLSIPYSGIDETTFPGMYKVCDPVSGTIDMMLVSAVSANSIVRQTLLCTNPSMSVSGLVSRIWSGGQWNGWEEALASNKLGSLNGVSPQVDTAPNGSILVKDDIWSPVSPVLNDLTDYDNMLMPVFHKGLGKWIFISVSSITPHIVLEMVLDTGILGVNKLA